jgi:dolichol-phosphate mannosyltransferase
MSTIAPSTDFVRSFRPILQATAHPSRHLTFVEPIVRAQDSLISVVIPSYNEEGNINLLFDELENVLSGLNHEIIFVDDGSTDGTLEAVRSLSARHPAVSYISFSRNFGHQQALRAGLEAANGKCVVSLDADLQHPPKVIPRLIEAWRNGADIVLTKRSDRAAAPFLKRLTSRLFYKLMRSVFGVSMTSGAADFRLLDRTVVEALKQFRDPIPFYRGFIGLVGFRQSVVEYEPADRHSGDSKYTLRKMASLARSGIIGTTVTPLRFAFVFAVVFFLFFFAYSIYIIWTVIFGSGVVAGWASTALLVALVGFMQSVSLAILSEYVAQISISTRGRPSYIVRESGGLAFDRAPPRSE